MAESKGAEEILKRVRDTLETAKLGLRDLCGDQLERRLPGLRNVLTFGRSVTFVIQNLRGVPDIDFEPWYTNVQAQMKADPLMNYFKEARNELEKQGKLSVERYAKIHHFSGSDMRKLGPPPPGATAFFMGDELGASGWEVPQPDGTINKYYVAIPASVAEFGHYFSDIEAKLGDGFGGRSVADVCREYIDKLERITVDAEATFGATSPRPESKGAIRKTNHLTVIRGGKG